MSFILGLVVGLGLSSKPASKNRGWIYLEPVGSHASNPFDAPPAPDNIKQVPDNTDTNVPDSD